MIDPSVYLGSGGAILTYFKVLKNKQLFDKANDDLSKAKETMDLIIKTNKRIVSKMVSNE